MSVLEYRDPVTGQWIEVYGDVTSIGGSADDLLKPVEFPDYVRMEAAAVAARVRDVMTDDSIVFLAMSDTHNPYDDTNVNRTTCLHTAMAAKALSYLLPLDFVAHLGDVGNGEAIDTPDMLQAEISEFMAYFREASGEIPMFVAIGNHDPGYYYQQEQTDGANHMLSGEWLYQNFTALSASEHTVFGGEAYGGYCYRDFPDRKLRVFLLNTSEAMLYAPTNANSDQATLGAQRLWLANALIDLNSKSDAAEWKFVILAHYPADYGETKPLSELLKAYVDGTAFTITDPSSSYYIGDGTNEQVNFTGKNAAKFVCQFHGHIHNFKTAKLNSFATGNPVEYDAWRMCIPNVQYNRENYYTDSYGGVYYNEDTSYHKTLNSAEDTSFVVNVINPSEGKVHSICYGAGYDRTVEVGKMGDVSSYTNLIPQALEIDGVTPYNGGKGYKTNTRLSTSSQEERSLDGMCVTGYIPVKHRDVIRIKNVTLGNGVTGATDNTFLWMYSGLTVGAGAGNHPYSSLQSSIVDGVITITINSAQIQYVRLACGVIDETSIVTVNQTIE